MATPSVTCYPTPGKPKALRLLEAFAAGAGGKVAVQTSGLEPGPAAFYGVVEDTLPLWRQVVAEKRGWYYLDNAYFDRARGTHFRVTMNGLQVSGLGKPDRARLAALGISISPWQRTGRHIVVCPQSDWFMRGVCDWPGGVDGWQKDVLEKLRRFTDRPIVVRHWLRDKAERAKDLAADLAGAWALVTHMSAAANEALLAGVPVFVTGLCAARTLGLSQLESIEMPRRPDGREAWAGSLAAQQWTEDELRDGTAWRSLHGVG